MRRQSRGASISLALGAALLLIGCGPAIEDPSGGGGSQGGDTSSNGGRSSGGGRSSSGGGLSSSSGSLSGSSGVSSSSGYPSGSSGVPSSSGYPSGSSGVSSSSGYPSGSSGVSSSSGYPSGSSGAPSSSGYPSGSSGSSSSGAPSGSSGVSSSSGAPSGSSGVSSSSGAPSGSSGVSSSSGSPSGSSGSSSSGSSSGGSGTTCPLPAKMKWTSTGPIANPKSPAGHDFVSLKDFSVVRWNNQYVVYGTVFDRATKGYGGVNFNFADWSAASAAPQFFMGNSSAGATVAPTIFYFTPKKQWVLTYQWGFQYATNTDPTQPSKWSGGRPLLINPPSGVSPIDQTLICDATSCYLFFAGDNGSIYRSRMPIGSFPGTFDGAVTVMSDTQAKLFEAVQVYTIKGTPTKYLMIVEAMGAGGRYFRSFTAPSLDGPWTVHAGTEAAPFAGKANVTFPGGAWTNDISHGDLVRDDPSETQTIDPCNLRFLYQGRDPSQSPAYDELPYRPAVLTLTP